jgi:hypothetical protein
VAAGATVVFVTAALHLSFDAASHPAPWTNNDSALILFIATEMAAGARLYVDWLDPALPPIFFVARAAVGLSRIGIPVVLAYDFLVLAVAAAGLTVLVRSLRGMDRAWPAVVLAAAGYLFFVLKPGAITRDFGQREHLFALLLIPELFAAVSPSRVGWRPAWCAALGFLAMIKPQFAAILVLVVLTARPLPSRAADAKWFLAGAVAPFGLLWWHSAEAIRALCTETLSLHVSGAYALLRWSPAALLERGPLIVGSVVMAAIIAMALAVREDVRLRGVAVRGAMALAWGAIAVVHQQRYLPYHFTPLFGLAVVCGSWAAGEWLGARGRTRLAGVLALGLVVVGGMTFHLDVASNGDPLPVRLGQAAGADARILVASVYSHGLCTPYRMAPRCIGPESQATKLPQWARTADGVGLIAKWAAAWQERVRAERPELLALSTSDRAMPRGLTPARLLLERFPIVPPSEYVPLSPAAEAYVRPRGWIILRRRDVEERPLRAAQRPDAQGRLFVPR